MPDNQVDSSFLQELEDALQNLYDPGKLHKIPLGYILAIDPRQDPALLRQVLLDGIEALKPQDNVPEQGRAWRTYMVLFHRYVGQLSQGEVARTLGLSTRHLAREEGRALQLLADYIWSRFRLSRRTSSEGPAPHSGQEEKAAAPPSQEQELRWAGESFPQEIIAVQDVIQMVLKTASPLLQTRNARAVCDLPSNLPPVTGQRSALCQAILNLLVCAARSAPGGEISVKAEVRLQMVCISIELDAFGGMPSAAAEDLTERIEISRRLLALMAGTLDVLPTGVQQVSSFQISLPISAQSAVLVIDDNADTLELFRAYLTGTRYSFIGSRDPRQALSLAESLRPRLVVVDVMLPGMDGWEVLQRLREDPATRDIPVIVCSILPEDDLALAIGAAAYLRKPVSRPDFLAVLDHLALPARESPA